MFLITNRKCFEEHSLNEKKTQRNKRISDTCFSHIARQKIAYAKHVLKENSGIDVVLMLKFIINDVGS